MKSYLNSIKISYCSTGNGIQGRVIVQIIIEKDGSISDVKISRSVDPSLDREALRVVKAMPKWNPGKLNGIPVRVKTKFLLYSDYNKNLYPKRESGCY